MKRSDCVTVGQKLGGQLRTALKRIDEFEKENRFGLEHTALREQIHRTCELVDLLAETSPFHVQDFQDCKQQIGEASKKYGWWGWV